MHDDSRRFDIMRNLLDRFKIKSFVETGAWACATSKQFSPYVERVYTCESYLPRYKECVEYVKGMNISIYPIPSPRFFDEIDPVGPIMFYLDAHFEDYWPLPDELQYISRRWPKSIIVVDDCYVQGNPNFHGIVGGGGTHEPHLGGRTFVDDRPLDAEMISKNFKVWPRQIIFPNYATPSEKLIGYCVVNSMGEDVSVPEGFFQLQEQAPTCPPAG